jgi:ribosomal protein S18 acetylase RimI-like enzyme
MISHASIDDAPAINILVNSAYRGDSSRKGWTTEADLLDGTRIDVHAVKDLIRRPETVILKYEESGKIVGCVELVKRGQKIYLGMLSVSPELQAKGVGKQLLKGAEAEALKQGCTAIFMTVISIRHEVIGWYLRHGYIDTGERKPFEVPDVRWGIPKKKMEFVVLEKNL